jgi:hypothetical protein
MAQPFRKDYYRYLVKFMSFRDNTVYGNDVQFTQEELAAIKPVELVRYFCTKVYGTPDPGPDDNPTLGRHTSIEMAKKAISYYMPNKLTKWNCMAQNGNPTKSVEVNELIKTIKKKEVRKQGKPSQARRPLEPGELEQTLDMLNAYSDITKKYMVPTACKFQYTMVARLDDTAQLKEEDLKPYPEFPFALLCQMCWSKNVMEERDAPDQILLGSMDRRYCILLTLGIFLEVWCEAGRGLGNQYLFGESGIAKRTASTIYKSLKGVWDKVEFNRLAQGPIGTHSTRKLPATRARRCGCSKDDVDSRGRWRKRRVQDRYVSVNLPYPDAKVAAALCVGGPCMYQLEQGSGVTDAWLRQYVVPNILRSDNIQEAVAMVLALPLLWAAFDDEMEAYMPAPLRNRIRAAYATIHQLAAGVNPVRKVLLVVTGHESEVRIDPLFGDSDDDEEAGAIFRPGNNRNQTNEIRALYAQNLALRRVVEGLRTEMHSSVERIIEKIGVTNTNIRRIALQPVQRPRGANDPTGVGANGNFAATISPTPRTLHELWQEYEFGIGGRKAAKDFTAQERGRVKHKYTRRKAVWDKIGEMVRGGWTAQAAIDRIYFVYGQNLCVTHIINRMKADRARGGHPELRV